LSGTCVAIAFFGDAVASLDCNGLRRDDRFEQVMRIDGAIVVPYFVGADTAERALTFDVSGSITFPVDCGGDASPVNREGGEQQGCRRRPDGYAGCNRLTGWQGP
jgi:hypothetical protein